MGRRKRGTVARAKAAKNVMKSYWEKKRAAEVATALSVGNIAKETSSAHRLRLLADKLCGEEEVSDDNALVVISVGRLKELLLRNSCDSCGEQTQTEIKRKYFDCEVKVRCKTCDLVLCDSKPRKAKIGNFTEANSVLVFHSISNGYGRAGLSRLEESEPGTSGEVPAKERQKVRTRMCPKDDPVKVAKLPRPAAPLQGNIEVVEVKEEPTCTEEMLPLQEHDPLTIKPEPVPWQPSGSQEEPQLQESHAVYLKEEIDIKEEDIHEFNSEVPECATDAEGSLLHGPQKDMKELPSKRRKVV